MYEWESVDKYCHVVPRVVVSAFLDILVYDLEGVIMDIVLVNEFDVLAFTCIPFKDLDIVILYLGCLGYNIIVLVGYAGVEELLPLTIREMVVVQFLQLVLRLEIRSVSVCMGRYSYPCSPRSLMNSFSKSASLW